MRNFSLENYETIIFDCDGVLIDINELKCLAFRKAVDNYPTQIKDSFVAFCRDSFGISRYEKFKIFFSDFAKCDFNQEEYETFLKIYSEICKGDYMTCDLTEGCRDILEYLGGLDKKLYVASGSDEQELRQVFKGRDLEKYFIEVYGSPKTKINALNIISENENLHKALFIGDAYSDYKAANHFNIDFVYMSQYTIQSSEQDLICRNNSILTINNLNDLLNR